MNLTEERGFEITHCGIIFIASSAKIRSDGVHVTGRTGMKVLQESACHTSGITTTSFWKNAFNYVWWTWFKCYLLLLRREWHKAWNNRGKTNSAAVYQAFNEDL